MLPLLLPLHLTLLLTGAMTALLSALLAWPSRRAPGGRSLLLLLAAIAMWQLCGAGGIAETTVAGKRLWAQLQYAGIVAVAPLWLHFVLRRAGNARADQRPVRAALVVVPVLTLVAALTSGKHDLLWRRIELVQAIDGVRAVFHHGPVFWAAAAYNHLLLVAATAVLLRALRRERAVARRRTLLLLAGGMVPWAGNLWYLWGTTGAVDPTPLAFGITGLCAAIAVVELGLFDDTACGTIDPG